MNQELESRLAKLENCCADYRTQIGELEEKVLSHKEEEKRLHRTYEEMEERLRQIQEELNGQLRRTYEKMDEQLRSVRLPERGEESIDSEFNKYADIEVRTGKLIMEQRLKEIEKWKIQFNAELQKTRMPTFNPQAYVYGAYLNRDLCELYKTPKEFLNVVEEKILDFLYYNHFQDILDDDSVEFENVVFLVSNYLIENYGDIIKNKFIENCNK